VITSRSPTDKNTKHAQLVKQITNRQNTKHALLVKQITNRQNTKHALLVKQITGRQEHQTRTAREAEHQQTRTPNTHSL
jgi:hypothetical protein